MTDEEQLVGHVTPATNVDWPLVQCGYGGWRARLDLRTIAFNDLKIAIVSLNGRTRMCMRLCGYMDIVAWGELARSMGIVAWGEFARSICNRGPEKFTKKKL